MAGYWLNCDKCNKDYNFNEITKYSSLTSFLWNKFFHSEYNQSLLVFECPECKGLIRITYAFPKNEKSIVKVKHIVYRTDDKYFYQMLWETYSIREPNNSVYDFKYMVGKKAYGLTRPTIMAEKDLKELIETFNNKCHKLLKN